MNRRRIQLIAALIVLFVGATVVMYFWRGNPNAGLENEAFSYAKSGSPRAIPLLLQLGARGDKAAAGLLADIYVTGDRDLGVEASDTTAAYWAKRVDDEVGVEIYYAKAFLDGTEPNIPRDPARSAFWLGEAYKSSRDQAR